MTTYTEQHVKEQAVRCYAIAVNAARQDQEENHNTEDYYYGVLAGIRVLECAIRDIDPNKGE